MATKIQKCKHKSNKKNLKSLKSKKTLNIMKGGINIPLQKLTPSSYSAFSQLSIEQQKKFIETAERAHRLKKLEKQKEALEKQQAALSSGPHKIKH